MAKQGPTPWTWRVTRATLVAALLVLLAGPLMARGLIGWQTGLGVFFMAAVLAGAGGLFCLVARLRSRGSPGARRITDYPGAVTS